MTIAFNAAADIGNTTGTSLSSSYTCSSGSDRLLTCIVLGDLYPAGGHDDITATYNGVGSTGVFKYTSVESGNQGSGGGVGRCVYLFYWLGPATGSNTLLLSATNSHIIRAVAADYTGVAGSGQPDNTAFATNNSSTASQPVVLTPVASGCWIVGAGFDGSGNALVWTNATSRANDLNSSALADTNGIASGATTITIGSGGSNDSYTLLLASFAPVAGGLTLMGQACL